MPRSRFYCRIFQDGDAARESGPTHGLTVELSNEYRPTSQLSDIYEVKSDVKELERRQGAHREDHQNGGFSRKLESKHGLCHDQPLGDPFKANVSFSWFVIIKVNQ